MSGAINSGIDVAAVRSLVTELRQYGMDLVQAGANAASLEARVAALEAELNAPNPDPSRLRGLLTDVRNAVSGAVGDIIASGILYKINALLGA